MNYGKKLLEEATNLFTENTVFYSIYGSSRLFTVCKNVKPFLFDFHDGQDRICIKVKERTDTDDNAVAIYSKEHGFAEILKKGKPIKNVYELW